MSDISFWTGIIGGITGIIGCIAGLVALYDKFWQRRPRLTIFAPFHFTGLESGSHRPVLNVFLRIANKTQASTFLYLETMVVKVFFQGQWHKTCRLDMKPEIVPKTDLPEWQSVVFGVGEASYLSKFGNSFVTFEHPLCGYIIVTHDNRDILRKCSKLRISIEDCHSRLHTMTIDFEKQSLRDPDRLQ